MSSTGRIAIFQQLPTEGPGEIEAWIVREGFEVVRFEFWKNIAPPDPGGFLGCVVLGGSMNVYQFRDHPWLQTEIKTIETWASAGVRVLGVCLGAQLLADLLGAKVVQNPLYEIGWMPVRFSSDARLLLPELPQEQVVMHWHGDTFELPRGAVRLASSEGCPEQGFFYSEQFLALQFHPEVRAEMMKVFCPDNEHLWPKGPLVQSRAAILDEAQQHFPGCHRLVDLFLRNLFLQRDRGPGETEATGPTHLSAMLSRELQQLEQTHLKRSLREVNSPQGPLCVLDGREVVNFSSNDYLGLAGEDFLRAAFCEAAKNFGVGSGASRLISGNQSAHRQLDEALAEFKRTEAALSFGSGMAAAMGTIPSVVGRGDVVILDKLCHACLVDGAKLSGATLRIFPHNSLDKLADHLRWAKAKFPSARVLVVTESVFSMDGDICPLGEIVELKDRFGAWLMVDEAHGIGVIGHEGRGLVDLLGLGEHVEIQMGTLGKALGAAGGAIAGSRALIDVLINKARTFIFSTAPPAAQAFAAKAALEWLPTPAGKTRVAELEKNRRCLAEKFREKLPPAAIFPIMVGSEQSAVEFAARCLDAGMFVPAVRFPTVPKGKARLRLSLTAKHSPQQIEAAANLILASQGSTDVSSASFPGGPHPDFCNLA